ncbi:MAG: dihydrolipoyl dehydrogenase [Spirochaetales bacterium]
MPDQKQFDVAVIGAGPGGYVAALRAAQLGLSTAIVEKRESLGGTCLNIGCIPSKALLDSSELFARIRDEATEHGISVGTPKLDLQMMLERKDAVVKKLTGGVKQLVKGRKITHIEGIGSLKSSTEIVVESNDGRKQTVRAQHIILASGSVPIELPFLPFDGETVVSSTEALEFDSVPKEMVVVGAGAIGLELGSVWSRLGSHVTVVEIMQDVLPGWDGQVSKTMKRELGKQGIEFLLGHKVTGLTGKGKKKITVEDPEGKKLELPADKVLVAVGRRPYYDGLGIEELGVELHEKSKRIEVDEQFKTSLDGVYAIGDLIHGPMLAHKAEDEGVAVAEIIAGKPGHVNYEAVPGVVYTWPEAACVGKSEEQLKEAGIPYAKGAFGFAANGRALALNSTGGFVKILAHKETDRLLGAHIVGPWASDLISELVTVLEFGGSAEDVARIVHAHPTLPEAVKEAAMAVDKRSIHSL